MFFGQDRIKFRLLTTIEQPISLTPKSGNLGVIHKPRGQLRGRGVSQMTILFHKSYLVNVTTKGEGDQKYPKFGPRGLWMTLKLVML